MACGRRGLKQDHLSFHDFVTNELVFKYAVIRVSGVVPEDAGFEHMIALHQHMVDLHAAVSVSAPNYFSDTAKDKARASVILASCGTPEATRARHRFLKLSLNPLVDRLSIVDCFSVHRLSNRKLRMSTTRL